MPVDLPKKTGGLDLRLEIRGLFPGPVDRGHDIGLLAVCRAAGGRMVGRQIAGGFPLRRGASISLAIVAIDVIGTDVPDDHAQQETDYSK